MVFAHDSRSLWGMYATGARANNNNQVSNWSEAASADARNHSG